MAWKNAGPAVWALAALVAASTGHAQTTEEAEIRAVATYLDGPPPPDVSRESCGARLVAYALLYRREPDKYRNALFGALAIDDYGQRSAGQYNFIEPDEIASTIDAASALPAGMTDQRVAAALGFCNLRAKNVWVATEKAGRISLARVLRGAALALLLEGTDEDPLAIAGAIDAQKAAESSARP